MNEIPNSAALDGRAARSASARAQMLDAAEQLFAERGIEAVSLREIAAAAGQRNTSAAHYHFKDKQGLADALIVDRMARVEALRSVALEKAGGLDNCDAAQLLHLLWQPMLDICVERGGSWIVQFHLAYHLYGIGSTGVSRHPITSNRDEFPASNLLVGALEGRFPHLERERAHQRIGLVFMMFWMAMSRVDLQLTTLMTGQPEFRLEEIIKMAIGALTAPA